MAYDKEKWEKRYQKRDEPRGPNPPLVLEQYVDSFPDGKALDIATGTGRISVFLATQGYEVDAVEISKEGLKIAQKHAEDRNVEVNWIQGDALEYEFPDQEYDVITIRSFRVIDRVTDIKEALKPNGILFYQDHMRAAEPLDSGPRDNRYRAGANEVLRACLDLTVLHYKEFTTVKKDGRLDAYAQIIARNSTKSTQSLPRRKIYQDDR